MAQLKDLIVTGASRFVGGIFGNLTGNADSATKLLNARNIQINLSSTSAASFNGTANITPGVTNILAIGNGGTGATSASSALSNLGGVPLAGGTMTGALNFKNNTWNNVGDDAAIGDFNQVGKFCIKGLSGATGIYFAPYSGSTAQTITINGSGTMTISGTVSGTFSGSLSGNASSSSWLNTNSSLTYGASGFQYFNLNGTQGTIANSNNTPTSAWYHIMRLNHANSNGYFADIAVPLNDTAGVWWRQIRSGTNYGWFKILDSNNYTEYTVTKTGTGASGTWGISISGNAATATKLGTARTLTIGNTGKAFDGSANISFPNPLKIAYFGSDSANANGWYKVFTISQSGYSDYNLNLLVTSGYSQMGNGLLHLHIRCDNTTAFYCKALSWMYRYGFDEDTFRWVDNGNNTWSLYVYQKVSQYGRIQIQILTETGTSVSQYNISLTSNLTKETTEPSSTYHSQDGGVVKTCTGNASTATTLATARTLTIGNTGKTFNGSANVSWSLSEIGAAAASHGTHVTYGTSASALGTSSAGSASTVSRSDHVHALPALTSCTGTLTVAKGGTGSTTAAGARTNLGIIVSATEPSSPANGTIWLELIS